MSDAANTGLPSDHPGRPATPQVQTSGFATPAPSSGSRFALSVLRLLGWKIDYPGGLPSAQGLMIIAPHTSNWDVPMGVLYKWGLGLPLNFWAKHSLFGLPLIGPLLRAVGGLPVNRQNPAGLVEQMADSLRTAKAENRFQWLVITPEGTRKATAQWRSGFYRLALASGVPVVLAYIDYAHREIGFDRAVIFSGDLEADIAVVAEAYARREGLNRSGKSPVRWRA
ncbi:1-acyl-sn-glycerol-3-phosphate acyltransferase [Amphibiibacter pelophylacis]|uniref:1-acyl-sn-glycerol-3-phosphate acyltransferase n=1 Tax=Amphibiibacter pelophylacis TaxID=1799477 RepID=A0ACC6P585_9BURK